MYQFATGPLVWFGFAVLLGGLTYKLVSMFLLARKERSVIPTLSLKYGLRSLFHWLVPFTSRNTRLRPVTTIVSFVFHLCLIATPLLVMGHAVLWQQSWGVSWWSLPPFVADVMTLAVVFACLFFMLRRIAAPEVRNVTTWKDHLLLLVVVAPFLTAFIAHQQWLPYEPMIILHIFTGVIFLVAIPFTWLSHMLWFVFTRSYMGSEFGAVRRARDW